jgi:hypothetical protein
MESMLGLHFGNVLYFDGSDFTVVSEPTNMANGLAVSKNGK